MADCKKQKLSQDHDIDDDGVDIISSLPDCILSHILSFLPTKDAVATCILSTGWRDLWAGLPNIDLDDKLLYFSNIDSWYRFEYEYVPFMNFVERILANRDVSNIIRFRLSCRVCFCPSRVRFWISSAINRNVQELDLCLVLKTPFVLPCCVFNCQSLRVLKVKMGCVLMLPQTVSLPRLKTLCLALVEFSDDESVHKLFSGCNVVEDLYLSDCCWGRLSSTITVSVPTLRRLRIDDMLYCKSPSESSDVTIKLQLPNLVSFKYFGYLSTEILLLKSLSLLEASVFVLNQRKRELDSASRALELINEVENVKLLRLSTDTIKSLPLATRFFGQLPVFQKLTHMELSIGIESQYLEAFLEFLSNLPQLEILSFPKGLDPQLLLHRDVRMLMHRSKMYLLRLKVINLHFVHGSEAEMHVLKYLVKSAPALERIDVISYGNLCVDSKRNVIRQLVQLLLDSSRSKVLTFSS